MSFLFHKRTRKILNAVWGVVAVLIIISMMIFFAPGLVTFLTQSGGSVIRTRAQL